MNLNTLHNLEKKLSTKSIFKAASCSVVSLQLLKEGVLKEHLTKTPALLICVEGVAFYEDENGQKIELSSGDFYQIEPMVKHWVKGIQDAQLLLIK